MGDLRYCFEQDKVVPMLKKMKDGLAVIDSDGISGTIIKGILEKNPKLLIYDYLNSCALERERSYYEKFKHLRIAKYASWSGEYWIDITDKDWQEHIINEARKKKTKGAIGLYFDNTDLYYMCKEGFEEEGTKMMRKAPSVNSVYKALAHIILTIQNDVGLVVMPNGGDVFLRRFMVEYPNVIQTINQEGVFFENFKKNSTSDTNYYKSWCKWAQKRIKGKVRLIEYCTDEREQKKIKDYCTRHKWHVYFSKHKNLCGD